MRILKFIFLLLIFPCCVAFPQDLENDTIQLNDLHIKAKEPKIKTIRLGNHSENVTVSHVDPADASYLIDNLPYGELQAITLHFFYFVKNSNAVSKIKETRYEMTLYDLTENGNAGKKINEEPISIVLEESSKSESKKTIDLSALHCKTGRFLIYLKRTSDLPPDDCALYLPTVKISANPIFHTPLVDFRPTEDSPANNRINRVGKLKCEIKTLTRYF
jgi:hypothetical protein